MLLITKCKQNFEYSICGENGGGSIAISLTKYCRLESSLFLFFLNILNKGNTIITKNIYKTIFYAH